MRQMAGEIVRVLRVEFNDDNAVTLLVRTLIDALARLVDEEQR